MYKKNDYLKLFSHNIAVKGIQQSAIYNLQDQKIIIIPNILFTLLNRLEMQPISELEEAYGEENKYTFNKYIDFLLDKNLGFITQNPELFPELEQEWFSPETINNAILDYRFTAYNITNTIEELHFLGCKHLELRLTLPPSADLALLYTFIDSFQNKVFKSINLIIENHPLLSTEILEDVYCRYGKVTNIIMYNVKDTPLHSPVISQVKLIKENLALTQFHDNFPQNKYFVNRLFFMEALQYNVFYNKKICINHYGEIKNYLTHQKSFGNVNTTTLTQVLENNNFKELWQASPDKIESIKDSELRYCMFITNDLERLQSGGFKLK